MNVLKYLAAFSAGAGVGWFITKKCYDKYFDEVLEDYDNLIEEIDKLNKDGDATDDKLEEDDIPEKPPVKIIVDEPDNVYTDVEDYHEILLKQKYNTAEKKVRKIVDHPFEIEMGEYGTVYDYNLVQLNYYADEVLTDEYDNVVDDVEEIIGDVLDTADLIPYSDIYVRNDAKRCDYKIFIDPKTFERLCEESQLEEEYNDKA